jgi:pyridoxamine 5'-phosphate oxidase
MELRRSDLDPDPLAQFAAWFLAAGEAGVPVPEAMALATAAADGAPSVRMVLLKGFDERGLVFFTSYGSRKGRELEANPRAALLFHWQPLGRQVRVEGAVSRAPAEESDEYFRSRPLGSRLSATASDQSEPIAARVELETRVAALEGDPDPPRPADWGGYVLAPVVYEFWQHRDDRLHDRFRYEREAGGWQIDRLQP